MARSCGWRGILDVFAGVREGITGAQLLGLGRTENKEKGLEDTSGLGGENYVDAMLVAWEGEGVKTMR